ncbi:uncharacterized protein LMH87_007566 [Akanthomyces muscarius]|uniref:Uncharacterized protein n=1 Tax=Akanthomyces muscarius TaxID=2231603 RepID=A0A9W8URE7_AKAMU|nr:uncharacterized protein LMH87_007566 [Akanthomyces muscarius]KAJ4161530.1 hypothetical protein LMH87_007566 [Akanthomyces muscarius]
MATVGPSPFPAQRKHGSVGDPGQLQRRFYCRFLAGLIPMLSSVVATKKALAPYYGWYGTVREVYNINSDQASHVYAAIKYDYGIRRESLFAYLLPWLYKATNGLHSQSRQYVTVATPSSRPGGRPPSMDEDTSWLHARPRLSALGPRLYIEL